MLPSQHWARNFTVTDDDLEFLTNLLLEKETPLSTQQLAVALIDNRLAQEKMLLQERFKDTQVYNPAVGYEIGQKVIFPHLNFASAKVTGVRPGLNPEYGDFKVIAVQFDDAALGKKREFASELATAHLLNQVAEDESEFFLAGQLSSDEIFKSNGDDIVAKLETRLKASNDLVYMARRWFPKDLILEVNEGHLNLAEAVLDIAEGGPLKTEEILEQIGKISSSPMSLQVFSMNYALNQDSRFDEVGPAGEVLWYLSNLKPAEVQRIPPALHYTPIDYDRALLTPEMLDLEQEIDDELSPISRPANPAHEGTITIHYPHRRVGTLPLNSRIQHIFPTALRTSHIWITLIDGQDGEEFTGWVVPEAHYVFGLAGFYRKHQLPIGANITVSKTKSPGKIRVDFIAHRPRTEWIRLITCKGDQILFENSKRAIGAEYDDLMILGVDNLQTLDTAIQSVQQQKKSLVSLLRTIIPNLGKLTPQGTAHVKTIYSAINVLRRCPPGPIMATLVANPDFENVGGHYWKLTGD